MKTDITQALVNEHRHILQVITLLEQTAPTTVAGLNVDWQFYLDCVDFIRSYADRFHHAKEEGVLFAALVKNGMPRDNSPVAAMLMEHDQGRNYVREMERAVLEAKDGIPGLEAVIAENALAYAALLRDHIAKEDDVLYPLAERVIPETIRQEIVQGYRRAEAASGSVTDQHYWKLIESC